MQALLFCAVFAAAAPTHQWTKEMAKEVSEFRATMKAEAKEHLSHATSFLETTDFTKEFGDFDTVEAKMKQLSDAITADGQAPSSFLQTKDEPTSMQKIQDKLKAMSEKIEAEKQAFDEQSKAYEKPMSFVQLSYEHDGGVKAPDEDRNAAKYGAGQYSNKMPSNPDDQEIKHLDSDLNGVLDSADKEATRFKEQLKADEKEATQDEDDDDDASSFLQTGSRAASSQAIYEKSNQRVQKAQDELNAIVERTRGHANAIKEVAARTKHTAITRPSSFAQTHGVVAAAHHVSKHVEDFRARMEARSMSLLEKARAHGLVISDDKINAAIAARQQRRLTPSSFAQTNTAALDNNPMLTALDARLESLQSQLGANAQRFEREAKNNIFVETADRARPSSFIQAAEAQTNQAVAEEAVNKVGAKLNALQQRLAQESAAFDQEAEKTPFMAELETPSLLQTSPENDAFADLDSVQASLKNIQTRLSANTAKFDEQAKQTQIVEAAPSFVQLSAVESVEAPNFHKDDFDMSRISSLSTRINTELASSPEITLPSSFLQEDPSSRDALTKIQAKIAAEEKQFQDEAASWGQAGAPSSFAETDDIDDPAWASRDADMESNLKENEEKLAGIAKRFKHEANREKNYVAAYKAKHNMGDVSAEAAAFAKKIEAEAGGADTAGADLADASSFIQEGEPDHLPGPGWAMAEMLRRGN